MLDALAKRYSTLPSKLLCDADSFDLMVFDVAVTYEKMLHDKQNKKVDPAMYDQQELENIMTRVKNR